MPEELFAIRPFALGGKGDFSRADIRMATKAIRRFGLSQEQRQKMLACAEKIMDESPDEKTKLLAVKMLSEMDKIDATREEHEITERHHETIEATAVLRAAMQSPALQEQLAKLSDGMTQPLTIEAKESLPVSVKPPVGTNGHVNGDGKK